MSSPLKSLLLLAFAAAPVTAADPVPNTLAEIRAAVNWAKIPQPPGAAKVRHRLSTSHCTAPGTYAEVAEFYRKALPPLGWVEDKTPVPGLDPNSYLSVSFDKGAMQLSVSGYRSDPKDPVSVTLSLSGNVDLRQFPKPADAKAKSDARGATYYSTGAKPLDAAEFCRKGILERGWKEVKADSFDFHAKEGRFVYRYLKNAMEITVVASTNKENQTEVTRSVGVRHKFDPSDVRESLAVKENPTPATLKEYIDVLDVRKLPVLDGAKLLERRKGPLALSNGAAYKAPGKVADAEKLYGKALADAGWALRDTNYDLPDRIVMIFEKSGYHADVTAHEAGGKGEVQVGVVNHGNVDLRLLPYPDGAEIGAERAEFVNCTTPLGETDAKEYYRKELGKLGWKEDKARGRGMEFSQNAAQLSLEIGKAAGDGTHIKVRTRLIGVE